MPDTNTAEAKPGLALRIRWWREIVMLRALLVLSGWMSPARASALGRRVMTLIGPRTPKHRHVLANLRIVCPERDSGEIEALGRQVWGNLGANLGELVHLETLTDRQCGKPSIEIVCENQDPDFLSHKKPCVFVGCHLGNWELLTWGIEQSGFPVDVVYNPLLNPYIDRLILARREKLGGVLVPRQNAMRKLLRSIKQGRSVGLLVDVRVDDAPLAPFAGLDATTTTVPAWLARKFGCDIVPMHTEHVGDARIRITLHPSIPWRMAGSDEPKPVEQLTAEMNDALAALIRRIPGQWLCTKRRWPKHAMQERGAYPD